MATYTSNVVPSDPDQKFELTVTLSGGTFSWSVKALRNDGQTGNVTRNNIYGLTVNIGGNSYYKGDIAWQNYTPGSVVYSGTTLLSACNITGGAVAIGLTGNYWYGTWNSTYKCTISGSFAVASPTVLCLDVGSNLYSGSYVELCSTVSIGVSATVGTAGNTITGYRIYFDGNLISTSSSISFKLPSGTSHTFYAEAIESNGAVGTSSVRTLTALSYTPPSFTGVSSVRWSTGDNTGVASDDGEYARLTPTYTQSVLNGNARTTYCKMSIVGEGVIGTVSASGTDQYTGQILSSNQSYTVIYELYDSQSADAFQATSETSPIVASDIITIGGRGIDLIHTGSDYGVAVGMKATAGYFDSSYPIRANTVNAQGVVTAQAVMGATPTALSSAVSRTSGLSINSQTTHIWGRVAMVSIQFNQTATYSAGADIFKGSVSSTILPLSAAKGISRYGEAVIVGSITPAGSISIVTDKAVSFASGNTFTITFIYLF